MSWLKIIAASLQLVLGLVTILKNRQLLAAGEAEAIAEGLELTNERIKTAQAARQRAYDGDPDPHDPYMRD
jgi:cyanate lyase